MKLLVIGDIHGKIEKLQKEIPKHDFDFVIGIGDYAGIEEWTPYIKYLFKTKLGEKRKSPQEFFGKEKFKEIMRKDYEAGKRSLKFLDDLGKPGFFVFGNGDDDWYDFPFSKDIINPKKRNLNFLKKMGLVKDLNYNVKKYGGISFLGFGGYLDAKANDSSRNKKWQERVDKRMKKAEKKMDNLVKKIGRKSIFVFHYPPLGVFDKIKDKKSPFNGKSVGVDFFRKAILKKKPFLVLCGHMHEYVGKKKLGDSLVVNPGEGSEGMFAIVDVDDKKGKIKSVNFYGKKINPKS